MNSVTQCELAKLFAYSEETGVFTRKVTRGPFKEGEAVGFSDRYGYMATSINGKTYFLHRLAWLYVYGEWPKNQIDHINRVKNDNRIGNLRDVDSSENTQNRGCNKTNKLNLLGVTKHNCGKYQSVIKLKGKSTYLGLFKTPEEAHAAYLVAKKAIHITVPSSYFASEKNA